MRVAHFTVPGTPIAQPRPRVTRNGTFAAAKDHKIWGYRADILTAWYALDRKYGRPFEGPISVGMKFWFSGPQSNKRKDIVQPKVTTPDLDNLAKGALDVLTNVAFLDDKFVYELRLSKWLIRSGMEPRTEISISEAS